MVFAYSIDHDAELGCFVDNHVDDVAHDLSQLIDAVLDRVAKVAFVCNVASRHQLQHRETERSIVFLQQCLGNPRADLAVLGILS